MARFFADGGTDRINIADDPAHDVTATDSFAIAAWLRLEAVGTQSRFVLTKHVTGGWKLGINATEQLFFESHDGTDVSQAVDPASISAGVWYHAIGLLNRGDNLTYLFKDGVQVDTTDASLVGSLANTGPTRAGLDNGTLEWYGRIAHCMMWKKAAGNWTAQEIELLKMSRFGVPVLPQLLQLWWPLWGTTSPEPDWSGGNFHGTVTGATREDGPVIFGMEWITDRRRMFTAAAVGSGGRNLLLLDVG